MADRSRREKASKLDKLAELKRVREGGKRQLKEEDTEIYDVVTEDQYQSIVKGRLQRDDFVEDDGADGYVDNGMDDWTGGEPEYEESEDETDRRKAKKKATKTTSKAKAKPPPPKPVPASINAYRPARSAKQETDFLDKLLNNMDQIPAGVPSKKPTRKRKPSPTYESDHEPAGFKYRSHADAPSSDGPMEDLGFSGGEDFYNSPHKRQRVDDSDVEVFPTTEGIANLGVGSSSDEFDNAFDDFSADELMQIDDQPTKREETEPRIPKKVSRPGAPSRKVEDAESKPAWLSVYESLAVEPSTEDSLGPLTEKSASVNASSISALEPDGSLRFFWLDYLELEGKLYFIGKLKDKTSGAWVSCCITVENMERNLFVLPRDKKVELVDEDLVPTDIIPSEEDINNDFDAIRKQMGIKSWRGKFVSRKYAFGEEDIPRGEAQWMKVVYGFDEKPVPNNACSENISRVLGTNTSAFELFVLKRKIMGPCWIQIKNPQIDHKGISWCKLEATVSDPKDFNPFADTDSKAPRDLPPLNIMSLNVRTIVNHHDNKREVVCVSARIWHNMQLEDPTPPDKLPCTVHTYVRPLDHFPANFEKMVKNAPKGAIMPMKNERMLLSSLLMAIYKADPDIIVGHDFLGVSLDVLLNRMRDLKADHWSRLGRFRRSKWPNIGRQGSNLKFLNGRLLCDLASNGAKDMIASTTWSLTEMCKTHLKIEREDYDHEDTAAKMDGSVSSPAPLLKFVRHCELDAHLQMAIAAQVQILPLTRQLTNLAGNSWNKTLNGGRAERNEYILLHEFHRLKYICPDKMYGKKSAIVKEDPEEDEQHAGNVAGKKKGKKDTYKGGLVFDPLRGLWDKYILVMDFNSLYPSIIQEYNIDFTTVEAINELDDNGEEKLPPPPPSGTPQGVLPRLIATLVNRRRQVKGLMKDRKITDAQRMQFDIKQIALKLTANSMYGCLGFEYSRFYAKQLAALTTSKGRSILMTTKELAEGLNLQVVYGDTDSVFVNSNEIDFDQALKIAAMFKKAVNEQYKLLEIDLDSVFQRLLLLQKKKYAALKVEDGDGTKTTVEVKGLDMKRREYCVLSKKVSQYILDQILSGEATETVVEKMHEYLMRVNDDVRNAKIDVEEFIIFKRLGKNPEDYPDAKSQPHVQVALRMKQRGGSARTGDVIPYIFCLAEGEETSKSTQADRAKHPDELKRAGSSLKIDYEHYLSQQILPPIERLCDPIEGTDRARLAECLGLDPMRYRTSVTSEEISFSGLDSQMSDAERFREAAPLIIRCRHCQGRLTLLPLSDPEQCLLKPEGPICPACSKSIKVGSIQAQLEVQIREHIAKYYEGWTICDDQTCGNRTRMMRVYGRRCLRPDCMGKVSFEYTDLQLYNQLRFFAFLFDGDKACNSVRSPEKQEEIRAIAGRNGDMLATLHNCVEKYLNKCGRRWVDLGVLFAGLK
ncbi:hypothetical protein CPB83DRAFT_860041 [Crepidotus variabilis]|uniref:DNA polymerase n=1 Tax=Crepidotus variabilis TaxID=179855 RepID=A0A9P6E9A9_9AGAR|nr:hypothetical protein CPB83DRAFT_860041 [Crepidotus variabilis]